MGYFPLFHQTDQLHALIVGGGRVALRRAKALTQAGVTCDLVAATCRPELAELITTAGGKVIEQVFDSRQVQTQHNLLLALTDNKDVNQAVAKLAQERGLLSNVADDPSACLLYTSPSPRDATLSRMPSSA